ncbi:MAG: hypothetical protein Q4B67_00130 [Eubacteriales bacterium]|nr:hypothetical protein [Eubacteriales bacterium]
MKKKNLIYSVCMCLLALLTLSASTYSWFVSNNKIATLVTVIPPQNISVLGPNAEKLERLDLSYTGESIDGNKVTIYRIICVQSSEDQHSIEVVHTTNMKNLKFKLYPMIDGGTHSYTDISASNPMTISYDKTAPLAGAYINEGSGASSEHVYANSSMHSHNYDVADKVQVHAEPIYWKITATQDNQMRLDNGTRNPSTGTNSFYVLEISWTENSKETDVFYILAKNG